MPLLDGLAATRLITADEDLAGVKVLILTTFEIDEYVFEALRTGASGFLGTSADAKELLQAIRTVNRGDALLSPGATGLSNDKIATQLVLSPATVKTHVNRAMIKVSARDHAQLVVFAHRSGLAASRQNGSGTTPRRQRTGRGATQDRERLHGASPGRLPVHAAGAEATEAFGSG